MCKHFAAIADATDRQILINEIPYWASVNLTNDTLLALAEMLNIVGVTDSSGIILQSLEQPARLLYYTGGDPILFTSPCNGGIGDILVTARVAPERYIKYRS